jgi:hypothetical protein
VELGAHRHVIEMIDLAVPGFVEMVGMLLDAYAADERAGSDFAGLTVAERDRVLRALCSEESQDARDVADALFVFTLGAVYSEWSGYDRASGRLLPPPAWLAVGYHGPVDGVRHYREAREGDGRA